MRYMTVKEYAELMRKTDETVYRWIDTGKLHAIRNPGGKGWLIKVDSVGQTAKSLRN